MKNILITVLSILVIALSAFIVYDKFIKKDDKKEDSLPVDNNKKEEKDELTPDALNELYSLIGINTDKEFTYCSNINMALLSHNGLISDMDKGNKQEILYYYAWKSGYMVTVTGDEYNYCKSGINEECRGLSKENYLKIAKKYNITDDFDTVFDDFERYNGLVVNTWINLGGCSDITKHTLETKYENNTIVMEDKIDYYDFLRGEDGNYPFIDTKNAKYTFNKLSDGTYALYSVENK